jgi:drug/metabolite transporter (DMT)-like permease
MADSISRVKLSIALCVAILAVSTASILIRFAQREAPSLTIAALRLTFATIILAPFALARHREDLRALGRREILLAAVSGLFLALHFGTWISSLEYTTVASSVVLVSTGPLWVALLAPIVLREHLASGALLGLGLAIAGGIVIGLAGSCMWTGSIQCPNLNQALEARALRGNFLALVGAWAVSGYLILGRRLRRTMQLVPYILLTYGFAAIGLLLTVFLRGETLLGFQPSTYAWMLLLAIVPQLIGHSTYNWALRFLPAALVAVTTLGEPIGSATLAYLILREVPGPFVILGGGLILAGIYLAVRRGPGVAGQADRVRSA